jgi:hypothetical protein
VGDKAIAVPESTLYNKVRTFASWAPSGAVTVTLSANQCAGG